MQLYKPKTTIKSISGRVIMVCRTR